MSQVRQGDVNLTTWRRVLSTSERVDWRLDEVLTEDATFDFGRPFLPNVMTDVAALPFLTPAAKLTLGHIRAHGYLGLFGIVEELILPFVLDHARRESLGALEPVRALLCFASEEAKHIALFRRFGAVFERQFHTRCQLVGPAADFAQAVLAHPELSVALAILHIEWMTQQHWLDCVRGDEALDPAFKRLLRYHWLEEAQHARLDALLVSRIAESLSAEEREQGIDGYLSIVDLLDGALARQAELDSVALQQSCPLALEQVSELVRNQHRSLRRAFLLSGMRHPQLLDSLARISPAARERISQRARQLS